jgi:predicted AlkP superfamily pyrophosphatase or phosphodiesterase
MALRSPRLLILLILAVVVLAGGVGAFVYLKQNEELGEQPGGFGGPPPRLVVLVVFDQMRGDYLDRWEKLYGPDGFRRLQRDGAWFRNCHFPYAYTATAPGHASLATSCSPMTHGIIANAWYDRQRRGEVQAVRDPHYRILPGRADPKEELGAGPDRRQAASVGDSLHKATAGKAKVVVLSLKDRAAILLAALAGCLCLWFSTLSGDFVTSTYYTDAPPAWVTQFNNGHPADKWFATPWTRLRSDVDYDAHSGPDNVEEEVPGIKNKQGRAFPHPMDAGLTEPGRDYYETLVNSPFGNDLLLELAKRAIDAEKLGQHDVPDLLCLSFSSTDSVGHYWGPDSHEMLDTMLRSDLIVKELLTYLDAKVGKGRYVLVLTADHGICPLPAVSRSRGKDAARINPDALLEGATKFLSARYPALGNRVIEAAEGGWVYLNRDLLEAKGLAAAEVERTLAEWLKKQEGVQAVYTRSQLSKGPLKGDALGESVRQSFHPERSGDVMILLKPYYLGTPAWVGGTDHGTPHPYDTHVPLLVYGPGVRPGTREERVSALAVAAILARALGVPAPEKAEVGVPENLMK